MGSGQLGEEAGNESRPLRVRAFFGLPLPDEHRERLRASHLGWPASQPEFRWTRLENLHITVRFLGHIELATAERIAGHLQSASPVGFALQLGEVSAFKRGRLASVVWVGLSLGTEDVSRLSSLVEAECARAGLEGEKRRFHPHMTLARSRQREGAPVPKIDLPDLPPWRATELVLYRSHLGRTGPTYETLRSISLR